MTTFTLGRTMDAEDFLFVALNDSSYADWSASRSAKDVFEKVYTDKSAKNTFRDRIKKILYRK